MKFYSLLMLLVLASQSLSASNYNFTRKTDVIFNSSYNLHKYEAYRIELGTMSEINSDVSELNLISYTKGKTSDIDFNSIELNRQYKVNLLIIKKLTFGFDLGGGIGIQFGDKKPVAKKYTRLAPFIKGQAFLMNAFNEYFSFIASASKSSYFHSFTSKFDYQVRVGVQLKF